MELKDITAIDLKDPFNLTVLEQLQIIRHAANAGINTGEAPQDRLMKVHGMIDELIGNWISGRYKHAIGNLELPGNPF